MNGTRIASGGLREMEESEVDVRLRITIMLVGALCGAVAGILTKLWFAG